LFRQPDVRREVIALNKLSRNLTKQLKKNKLLSQLLASKVLKKVMIALLIGHLEVKTLCNFLSGITPFEITRNYHWQQQASFRTDKVTGAI
jgi:hypothetical protein